MRVACGEELQQLKVCHDQQSSVDQNTDVFLQQRVVKNEQKEDTHCHRLHSILMNTVNTAARPSLVPLPYLYVTQGSSGSDGSIRESIHECRRRKQSISITPSLSIPNYWVIRQHRMRTMTGRFRASVRPSVLHFMPRRRLCVGSTPIDLASPTATHRRCAKMNAVPLSKKKTTNTPGSASLQYITGWV